MGEFKSGVLALSLFIYLSAFIFGLAILDNFTNTFEIESLTHNGEVSNFIDPSTLGSCQLPRSAFNPVTGLWEDMNVITQHSTKCEYTTGNIDETGCNSIDGCSYQLNTFLWFTTGTQGCVGLVNLTSLGVDAPAVNIYGEVRNLHEYIDNQDTCELFGFTWTDAQENINSINLEGILTLIGDVFTFRISFSESTFLSILITFIAFYIPLIAFIIALYFMLPFLH